MSIRELTARVREGEKSTTRSERKRRLYRAHIIDASGKLDSKYFRIGKHLVEDPEDPSANAVDGVKVVCKS
mgnify:CR=1 FL=1